MAAVTLALMLLGAFFLSQRSFVSLSRHNDDDLACRDSLLAVADYCRFRLEKEPGWALTPPETEQPPTEIKDQLARTVLSFDALTPAEYQARPELHDLQGVSHILASMPANSVSLHLAVSNYLKGSEATSPDGVPRGCCRLRIEAVRGTSSSRLEILLHKVALFDSTVFASRDIRLDAEQVVFNSSDPVRNQVRSLQAVRLPAKERLIFREGEIDPPPIKGTVWAQGEEAEHEGPPWTVEELMDKGEIFLNNDHSQTALREASESTGALFFPNDAGRYNPPSLGKEQIKTPDSELELKSAIYQFAEVPVTYLDTETAELKTTTIKTMQVFEPAVDVNPLTLGDPPSGLPTDFYYDASTLPTQADPSTIAWALPDPPAPGASPPLPNAHSVNGEFEIPQGPRVNLRPPPPDDGNPATPLIPWNPLLTLPADTELRVRAEGGPDSGEPADFQVLAGALCTPELMFAKADGSPGSGMLNVDRNLILQSSITGSGRFLAGKDIHMIPNDTEVLADVEGDVALYAGGDVKIRPRYTGLTELLNKPGFFTFRGLVYAKGDFLFAADKGGAAYNRKLDIEGALVARNGSVLISGPGRAAIRYNPDYLDSFLEEDFLDTQIQVEELSWRPH